MASFLFKLAAKRALQDKMKMNTNSQDPFYDYEEIEVHKGGKTEIIYKKKGKKPIPKGLSKNDAQVLKGVRSRAYHLDMSLFSFCGIRFGWSSVIGLVPAIGDVLDALMALILVKKCMKVDDGLPLTILSRMVFNILVDFVIGLVPFVGDLADAAYRANIRNAWLLELYLVNKYDEMNKRGISDPADLENQPSSSAATASVAPPKPAKKKFFGRGGETVDASAPPEGRSRRDRI
ncbi:hypothetical protein PspLS_00510 [Pyricularia sp. CBS 133598]|nr:hypothetical protein PspLS_00510 [Pyricularia sp. CBS 133598]